MTLSCNVARLKFAKPRKRDNSACFTIRRFADVIVANFANSTFIDVAELHIVPCFVGDFADRFRNQARYVSFLANAFNRRRLNAPIL